MTRGSRGLTSRSRSPRGSSTRAACRRPCTDTERQCDVTTLDIAAPVVVRRPPPRILPAGWPVLALFAGWPVWWLLGAAPFAFPLLAVPMVVDLLRRRRWGRPPSLVAWLVFVAWMLAGAVMLRSEA